MWPGERTTSQVLHDLLTSVTRTDQAILTALENPNIAGLERAWRALVNPDEARPEDLRQLAERLFGVDGGIFGFLLDMGLSPTMWFGLPLAKYADRLGFGAGKPTQLTRMWARDFGDGYIPGLFRNYIGIAEDIGQPHWGRLAVVQWQRQSKFEMEALDRINRIIEPWIAQRGKEAWERRMADMMEVGLYRENARAWRDPDVIHMMDDIQRELWDWAWDRLSIIESLSKVSEKDLVGAKKQQRVLDFLQAKLDLNPMGWIGKYLPRMIDPEKEMLDVTLDSLNLENLHKTPLGRLAAHVTDIQSFKNVKGAALGEDTLESAMALRQLLTENDTVRRIAAAYRNPRMQEVVDPELAERVYQMDWMKVVRGYIRQASRSFALQVPLEAEEARWVHMAEEGWVDVRRELFEGLNPILRHAIASGDELLEQEARGKIAEVWGRIPYHQRSIDLQMTLDAAEHFGTDVFKRGDIRGMSTPLAAQARAVGEMMKWMRGQHDPKEFWVSQGMANLYVWISRHLTDERVKKLDQAGRAMGVNRPLGTMLRDELLNGESLHSMAQRERTLTHWSYLAGLGLRPFAALINLTQIPVTTMTTIGPGNTLRGAWEAGRAVRDAMSRAIAKRRATGRGSISRMAREGLLEIVPELREFGLVEDIRHLEAGIERRLASSAEDLPDFLMGAFTWAETLNRLTTFFGARGMWRRILRENPAAFGLDIRELTGISNVERAMADQRVVDFINRESVRVVGETQFLPIPGRRTPFQTRFLRGPAMMQFSSYPFQFLNWMMDAGVKGAIDHRAGLVARALYEAEKRGEKIPASVIQHGGVRNWLPYARYLVAMTGLTNIGRDVFGWDMAERVASGSAPLPISDDSPFYPFPTPPIPGAVYGIVKSVLTGRVEDMQPLEVPGGKVPVPRMFVPGGVAVSHASRVLNQVYINGFTGDELMADEEGTGQAYMSFIQKLLRAMGAMPEVNRREQRKIRQMFVVRRKQAEYRRRLGTAVLTGNAGEIERVKAEYQSDPQFADAPPLKVDTDDLKRIYRRMRTSEYNRQVSTLKSAADALGFTADPHGLLEPGEEAAIKEFQMIPILVGGK